MRVLFFDLETQWIWQELGLPNTDTAKQKLRVAVAGTLCNGEHRFFTESEVPQLLQLLKSADLIVGHNLLGFDYHVLQAYTKEDLFSSLGQKTFDTMLEMEKVVGYWVKLDDICRLNFGTGKNVPGIQIPRMWREGRYNEVKDYLLQDLRMVEQIYSHGKGGRVFKHKNGVVRVQW